MKGIQGELGQVVGIRDEGMGQAVALAVLRREAKEHSHGKGDVAKGDAPQGGRGADDCIRPSAGLGICRADRPAAKDAGSGLGSGYAGCGKGDCHDRTLLGVVGFVEGGFCLGKPP